MQIKLKLFAALKEHVRSSELVWESPSPITGDDLIRSLADHYPAIAVLLEQCSFVRNGYFFRKNGSIQNGDDIAILPPFSGG